MTVGHRPAAVGTGDDLVSIGSALGLAAISVFPVFLTGALGVQLSDAFGLDAGGLGLTVSLYFAASACCVAAVGRLVQRVGARLGVAWGAGLATASLLAAAFAPSRPVLVIAMMVGGVGNAVVGPTTSLLLARVSAARRGLGFGAKQAAIMVASMLGGIALPAIGLLLGWRWVYVVGAAIAAVVGFAGWRVVEHRPGTQAVSRGQARPTRLGPLLPLAVGFGLGTAASTSLGVLLIAYLVAAGISEGTAGLVLAGGSVATILARLATGVVVDRVPGAAIRMIVVMLAIGAVGFLLMGTGALPVALLGTMLAFTAGWGWTGLIVQVIATRAGRGAAAATGVGQTGAAMGGIVGPSLLGTVAAGWSFGIAWLMAAALLTAAAGFVHVAGTLIQGAPSDLEQRA